MYYCLKAFFFFFFFLLLLLLLLLLLFDIFSLQRYLVVFHWSLSDEKSQQVSRTPLSISVDPKNIVDVDVLDFFSHAQVSPFFFQTFGERFKSTNYN